MTLIWFNRTHTLSRSSVIHNRRRIYMSVINRSGPLFTMWVLTGASAVTGEAGMPKSRMGMLILLAPASREAAEWREVYTHTYVAVDTCKGTRRNWEKFVCWSWCPMRRTNCGIRDTNFKSMNEQSEMLLWSISFFSRSSPPLLRCPVCTDSTGSIGGNWLKSQSKNGSIMMQGRRRHCRSKPHYYVGESGYANANFLWNSTLCSVCDRREVVRGTPGRINWLFMDPICTMSREKSPTALQQCGKANDCNNVSANWLANCYCGINENCRHS